jgi:AraC family transcriptional regulator
VFRNTSIPGIADAHASFDEVLSLASRPGTQDRMIRSSGARRDSDSQSPTRVAISPSGAAGRQSMWGHGIGAELVQSTSRNRIEFRYRGSSHLLVAYEQGVRGEGETFVDSMPPSRLRNVARRLTFVPVGHDYFEWHQLYTSARLLYVYLDPAILGAHSTFTASSSALSPRLLFEDGMLWSTVVKLKGLIESSRPENVPYFEALGAVLAHELVRLNGGAGSGPVRGGLAAWQQRLVAAYIEEHLSEQASLGTLARLARLSPYHFSRAFKQSFGMPPHRYHTHRRIERAKTLLERHALSITDIGLRLGFSETSSFTAAFRKTTGLTPSRYHRSITHLPPQN